MEKEGIVKYYKWKVCSTVSRNSEECSFKIESDGSAIKERKSKSVEGDGVKCD